MSIRQSKSIGGVFDRISVNLQKGTGIWINGKEKNFTPR